MNRYGDYTDFIMFSAPAIKGKTTIQIGTFILGVLGGSCVAVGLNRIKSKKEVCDNS